MFGTVAFCMNRLITLKTVLSPFEPMSNRGHPHNLLIAPTLVMGMTHPSCGDQRNVTSRNTTSRLISLWWTQFHIVFATQASCVNGVGAPLVCTECSNRIFTLKRHSRLPQPLVVWPNHAAHDHGNHRDLVHGRDDPANLATACYCHEDADCRWNALLDRSYAT